MSRPKKDGRRADGIQRKGNKLYIVLSRSVIIDGQKKYERQWINTGLEDTPENLKRAIEERRRLLEHKSILQVDRNITFSEFVDAYLEQRQREVMDTTYAGEFHKAKRIKEYFGETRVRSLTAESVEAFLDSLFTESELKPRTVKDIRVLLKNIIDVAVTKGVLAYNPVNDAVINKDLAAKNAKDKNADEIFFSYEEALFFLKEIRGHDLYEFYYMTLFFGLRREEALGLRWSAINLAKKTMRIGHTVTKGTKINRSNTTKTESSEREYPLSDEQVELLQSIRKQEEEYRRLLGDSYLDNDYVFKHADGALYYPDYPTKAFGKLIKKIPSLPQSITFHGLRKSCASILVHMGLDVKSIQKWLGHKDINTTLRIYAQVKDREAKKEISDALSNMLSLRDPSDPSDQ